MSLPQPAPGPPATAPEGSNVFSPTLQTATQAGSLPSGSTDIWDLGQYSGSTILLGSSTTTGPAYMGGPNRPAPPTKSSTSVSTASASDFAQQFASLSASNPKLFAQQQEELYAAGFYGTTPPKFGVYTTRDTSAMGDAIQSYARVAGTGAPITWSDYLDQASAAPGGPGGSPGPQPPPLQLTDPAELEQTLQQAGQNALGRKLSPKELGSFVSAFHGKEKAAYENQINGKTSTNPDVSGQALNFVDNNNGVEAQQRLQASYLDSLNKMLGVL